VATHPASEADPITLFDVRLHVLPAGCLFDIDGRAPALKAPGGERD
jgi:hypothetical protein